MKQRRDARKALRRLCCNVMQKVSDTPDCGAEKPSRSQTIPNKRNAVQRSCSDMPKTACQNGYWAVFLASMLSDRNCFYYCDEHFSYIQSDIEKRIFGLMLERLGRNEQLIFTTHNTDMLELNLPKHCFAFLKKDIEDGEYKVTVTFASEFLKRNTDSVKCAMENDVFGSLPDDSLLDELEADA